MKKISLVLALLMLAGLPLAGCSRGKTVGGSSSESSSEVSQDGGGVHETPEINLGGAEETAPATEPATEAATQAEKKPAEKIEPQEGKFVYDNAGVLTDEALSACTDIAKELYEDYLINAAVVTTGNLDGKSVYDFAADAYNTIYNGRGSGLLLVINEDSGNDYLYRSGSCGVFVDDDTVNSEFFWATKDIVAGDYQSAALRIMELGKRCPSHVFDNGGLFSREDIQAFEERLRNCSGNVAILATSNSTGSTNEEIARSYLERRFKDGGYMIMIDTQSGSTLVVSDKELSSDMEKAVTEANKSAGKEDYAAAASTLIGAFE